MAAYLGSLLSPQEIHKSQSWMSRSLVRGIVSPRPKIIDSVLRFVRAWRVPRLLGLIVECEGEDLVGPSLATVLAQTMPGTHWHVGDLTGPLRVHGILHAVLVAPSDETTGQPMVLEISGAVTQADRYHEGLHRSFMLQRCEDLRVRDPSELLAVPVTGPLKIRIDSATYSNTSWLGVDVPAYS